MMPKRSPRLRGFPLENTKTLLHMADSQVLLGEHSEKFPPLWDGIKEDEPDETDLAMLKAIEEDPECHEFTNERNYKKPDRVNY